MIPFQSGIQVSGDDFCGRQKELGELREIMLSHGRVYVVGERRIGKTSLILEAAKGLKQPTIYVDLSAVKTPGDVCQRIAAAMIRSESQSNNLTALFKRLSHLKISVSLDPVTNTPSVGLVPGMAQQPENLDQIFDVLNELRDPIIILDEFQDILQLKDHQSFAARLRRLIQFQQNMAFIFSGGIRHNMIDIFTNHDSPFYMMALGMPIGPIEREEFEPYLMERFARGQRDLSHELLDRVLTICHEIPGAVQRFCWALWSVTDTGQTVSEEDIGRAWEQIFALLKDQFTFILQELSPQQTQVLQSLAWVGGKSNVSGEFVALTGIRFPSSITKALNGLISKRIVLKEGKSYRILDPFFAMWLQVPR